MVLINSCATEKKIARDYVEDVDLPSLLILEPEFLYKVNRDALKIQGFEKLPQTQKDSIWLIKSRYLKYIADTIFVRNFVNALESIHNYDVGIGKEVSYSFLDHQGLEGIYYSKVSGDGTFRIFQP